MNQKSKRAYDSAHRQLKGGESATYKQVTDGTYANGEYTDSTVIEIDITCYEDVITIDEINKGLASKSDSKILIAAKAMPTVTPAIGDTIVFANRTLTVKNLQPVKSLEGVIVLHQCFVSAAV